MRVSVFRSRRSHRERVLLARTFYERNKGVRLNLMLELQLE